MHIFWNWEDNIWSNKVGIVAKKDKLKNYRFYRIPLPRLILKRTVRLTKLLEMKKKRKKKTIRNDVQQWLYVKDQPWVFNKKSMKNGDAFLVREKKKKYFCPCSLNKCSQPKSWELCFIWWEVLGL